METSLGRLQKQNDKLSKDNIRLRDNNDALKAENYQLRKRIEKKDKDLEDKIAKEIKKALDNFESKQIGELTEENNKLRERIFRLEQMLNISSENSSLPPSQDAIWHKDNKVYDSRSQKETTKKIGGQKGHKKHKLEKFDDDEITEIKDYKLDKCSKCNSDDLTFIGVETRDELDFDIVIKKTRYNFYKYQCNNCGEIIMCDIPQNLCAENQYGSKTQALGLALVDFGDVSYKRTRDIINGLTGGEINPSEGYLAKLPKRASQKLKKFVFDAEENIIKSPVVQHDDGVIKIGKKEKDKEDELAVLINKSKEELTEDNIKKLNEEIKKNFKGVIRAYTDGLIKLYKAHTDKSADTYKDDNILNRLTADTLVVHDHMKYNYNDLFKFKNAECNIHPIRKSRSVKVNTQHKWPDKISELLESYNNKRDELIKAKIDHFDKQDLSDLDNNYDQIISDGIVECNKFVHKNLYKDETNLLEFFKNYKEEILMWTKNFSVPFTNNLCETMIRLVKSKMKISYSFKNIESAQYYADIITYTETCFNFGVNRYEAIERLFNDNPYSIEELYKLIEPQEDNEKITNNN
jgi:hypothetical protein